MVTALLVIIAIAAFSVSAYLAWNQSKKNRILGDFIVQSYIKARSTYQEMKEIDAAGAFQTDDEVGAIFDALLGLLEEYQAFMTEYLEEVGVGEEDVLVKSDEQDIL